jgi:hypothetical protein
LGATYTAVGELTDRAIELNGDGLRAAPDHRGRRSVEIGGPDVVADSDTISDAELSLDHAPVNHLRLGHGHPLNPMRLSTARPTAKATSATRVGRPRRSGRGAFAAPLFRSWRSRIKPTN